MNRRNFLRTAAAVPLLAGAAPLSLASITPVECGSRTGLPGSDTPVRERYEATLQRVLSGTYPAYTQEFLLADVRPTPGRRFTEFSGDLSGRYVGALATAARVYHTSFPDLDLLVERIVALQKPDGYFGSGFHYEKPTDQDLALLWGNGRLLVGLLEYYRYKPSEFVLAACTRLGNFLVRISPLMLSREIRDEFGAAHFASSYICWTQQTEGLANLYRVTRDSRYQTLTEGIAAVIERRPGDHVHGYLTSLRGVMDLYQTTSDARLLRQCEAAWQDVVQSPDLLITGGVPEGWSPNKHRTEGCAEADWLRLNLSLWTATGDPKYLVMAERTTFNELASNQFDTGDFGHRVLSETGFLADGAVRAWWCCTLHGLRYFPDLQNSAFRSAGGALWYDLTIDSHLETASLSATATSSLAHNGTVKITITSGGDEPVSLRIRKPDWAKAVATSLNHAVEQYPLHDGYVHIQRRWKKGDVLTVTYAMALRHESSGPERIAYFYGPWLVGASASDNPRYFNDLTTRNKLSSTTDGARSAVEQPSRRFTVPLAATNLQYTPAEFPDQHESVVLRAPAEQTGQLSTSWELRFLTTTSPSEDPEEV
ncbi:MAG TPA: beta-L-arabinofuranosidase domain-containing protein [Acidobacteriaceae bacterium]|nr:beta-L-arabinofuranosidase domain-containing protein [Acidobacteriaceae bacterium]